MLQLLSPCASSPCSTREDASVRITHTTAESTPAQTTRKSLCNQKIEREREREEERERGGKKGREGGSKKK